MQLSIFIFGTVRAAQSLKVPFSCPKSGGPSLSAEWEWKPKLHKLPPHGGQWASSFFLIGILSYWNSFFLPSCSTCLSMHFALSKFLCIVLEWQWNLRFLQKVICLNSNFSKGWKTQSVLGRDLKKVTSLGSNFSNGLEKTSNSTQFMLWFWRL